MDKIVEALSKLLPEEHIGDVATAVGEMLKEAKAEIETDYNSKLEEAYAELSGELNESEQTAEKGYQEAWGIICDLRNRLDTQRTEFEQTIEDGYQEAYQMLVSERGKNDNVEVEMYEQYDKKLVDMKSYIVDKVDEFLQYKGREIYEQARQDVINDPRSAEERIALEKVVECVSGYLTDSQQANATSSRLRDSIKEVEDLRGKHRILEAKSIRLATENNKLTERVRHDTALINEHNEQVATVSKKERQQKAKNVQGRGKKFTEEYVPEYVNGQVASVDNKDADTTLTEQFGQDALHQMAVLSGLVEQD